MVACGNEQVFGINYDITFSAVMDLKTAKLLLTLARTSGIPARHGEVPNAYMKAPDKRTWIFTCACLKEWKYRQPSWKNSGFQVVKKWYFDYRIGYMG